MDFKFNEESRVYDPELTLKAMECEGQHQLCQLHPDNCWYRCTLPRNHRYIGSLNQIVRIRDVPALPSHSPDADFVPVITPSSANTPFTISSTPPSAIQRALDFSPATSTSGHLDTSSNKEIMYKRLKIYKERLQTGGKTLSDSPSVSSLAQAFSYLVEMVRADARTSKDPAAYVNAVFQGVVPHALYTAFHVSWHEDFSSDLNTQLDLIGNELFKVNSARRCATEWLRTSKFITEGKAQSLLTYTVDIYNQCTLAQVSPADFVQHLILHLAGSSFYDKAVDYWQMNEGVIMVRNLVPSAHAYSPTGLLKMAKYIFQFVEKLQLIEVNVTPTPVLSVAVDESTCKSETRTCFNCQVVGHVAPDCPIKRKDRKVRVCENCPDSTNHDTSFCRKTKKRRDDDQKSTRPSKKFKTTNAGQSQFDRILTLQNDMELSQDIQQVKDFLVEEKFLNLQSRVFNKRK